jgi:hypothetical protein
MPVLILLGVGQVDCCKEERQECPPLLLVEGLPPIELSELPDNRLTIK